MTGPQIKVKYDRDITRLVNAKINLKKTWDPMGLNALTKRSIPKTQTE